MFISIPEKFFVPVLFSDNFELNLENNNMEYDTEKANSIESRYRTIPKPVQQGEYESEEEVEKKKVKKQMDLDEANNEEILDEEELEKKKVEKEMNLDKSSDELMLDEETEEFIHSQEVKE